MIYRSSITAFILCLVCCTQSCKPQQNNKSADTHGEQETSTGRVIPVDTDDAEMDAAMQRARDSFGTFWKIISDKNTQVGPAMVKAYYADDDAPDDGEHLWIADIDYNGKRITGTVASEPLDLKKPKLGEKVSFPISQLSDWLLVRNGKAEGAYTVQLLRKRMSKEERAKHDSHYPFGFAPIR